MAVKKKSTRTAGLKAGKAAVALVTGGAVTFASNKAYENIQFLQKTPWTLPMMSGSVSAAAAFFGKDGGYTEAAGLGGLGAASAQITGLLMAQAANGFNRVDMNGFNRVNAENSRDTETFINQHSETMNNVSTDELLDDDGMS